jgi:hypothetical protein
LMEKFVGRRDANRRIFATMMRRGRRGDMSSAVGPTQAPTTATASPAQRPPAVASGRLPITPFARVLGAKAPLFLHEAPGIGGLPHPSLVQGVSARPEHAHRPPPTAEEVADERPVKPSKKWDADLTDPMVRSLHGAAWSIEAMTPLSATAPSAQTVSATSRVSLEQLLPKLVRRLSWSGDAQSGTARLELGEGVLEGATLIIHSDRGSVRVQLEVPPGADAEEWKARIGKRLDARGLQVTELDVR